MASIAWLWIVFLVLYGVYVSNEACSYSYEPCGVGTVGSFCSSDDETLIAYGAGSKWLYRLKSGGIDIRCDDATFGAFDTQQPKECCKQTTDLSHISTLWPVLNTISCGETIQTHFDTHGLNPRYFKFTADTTTAYTFRSCGTPYDTMLFLYDAAGAVISDNACSNGDNCGNCAMYYNEEFSITLHAGDYYVQPAPYDIDASSGWYYLSVSAASCPLPSTTTNPTPITVSPTVQTTPSPTGSTERSCGNNWCYDVDLYPSSLLITSDSVFITHADDNIDTTFEVSIMVHGDDCVAPVITFMFEQIDYDDAGKYLLITDSNEVDVLGKCGNVTNQCGKWMHCFSDPVALGVNRIKKDTIRRLYVFQSASVNAQCTDHHLYSINAQLTIICAPLYPYTMDPTQTPTDVPAETSVAPTTPSPTMPPLLSSAKIKKHVDIYPLLNTITSHNIIIQNTDDHIDTYFDIEIQPHSVDCVYPRITFSFQNIDFDASYEFLHILDANGTLIAQCSGSSTALCDEWISCFADPQSLDTINISKGYNYTIVIFEPQAIDGLCTKYHEYSIRANLTIICGATQTVSPTNTYLSTDTPAESNTTKEILEVTTKPIPPMASVQFNNTDDGEQDSDDEHKDKFKIPREVIPVIIITVAAVVLCCVAFLVTMRFIRYIKTQANDMEKEIGNTLNVKQIASNTEVDHSDDHNVEITTRQTVRQVTRSREMNRNILAQVHANDLLHARDALPNRVPSKDGADTKSTMADTKDTAVTAATLTYDHLFSASSPSNVVGGLVVPVTPDTNKGSEFVNSFNVTSGADLVDFHNTVTNAHIFGEPEKKKRRNKTPVLIVEDGRGKKDNDKSNDSESSSFTVNDKEEDEGSYEKTGASPNQKKSFVDDDDDDENKVT